MPTTDSTRVHDDEAMLLSRYAEVLTVRGAKTALAASVFGRISVGMNGLAILLLVKEATGSYAQAGAVSAAYAIGFALVSPTMARAADRRGPGQVLLVMGLVHPLVFVALLLAAERSGSAWAMAVAAALLGATLPPLGSVMRALWGSLVGDDRLRTAFSLDSVLVELCFVLGPVLVALLAATSSPTAPVIGSACFVTVGTLLLSINPAVRAVVPHEERPTHRAGPLVSPVVRACLLNVLWIGVGFGLVEVAVLAFVEESGAGRASAGFVLAVWSSGSMAGGLLYGGLRLSAPVHRQLPVLVMAVGLSTFLPVLAGGVVILAAVLFVCGSTIAPFSACNSVILAEAAPPGTVTEAFAWNTTMIFGGAALGTAAAGVLVEHGGAHWAFLATAAVGVLVIASGIRCSVVLRRGESGVARG